HPRDAGPGPPLRGPRRLPGRDAARPLDFLREGGERVRECRGRTGLGRRALPRAAPGDLHLAARDEAGQPPQRGSAAHGRAPVGACDAAHRHRIPARGAHRDLGDGAAAPVPRHPARLVHRLGAPRGARDLWPARGEAPSARGSCCRSPHRARRWLGRGGGRARPSRAGPRRYLAAWADRPGGERPSDRGPAAGSPSTTTLAGGSTCPLDNGLLRAVIDDQGYIVSLRDLSGDRELVPSGEPFGALELFRDQPVRWDAWDVDRHVLELSADFDPTPPVVTIHSPAGSDGAQSASRVTVDRTRGDSTFRVEFRLPEGAAELEIAVEVDWHEREHLLKLALPLDLHTRTARYETQYGFVERSVTANTSWDEAQYEV